MDISMKYGFIKLSQILHHYFKLEGEYIHAIETEVITLEKKNLRMDIAYLRTGNIINNIENQNGIVDKEKLEVIAKYVKFLLINNDALADSIVVCKVDPKYCQKEIQLTKTLFLRPDYLYKPPEEIMERLNNNIDKVNNNEKLTYDEACELAVLPTLAQDDIAPYVTIKSCELLEKDESISEEFKRDLCFILEIMIDRNINDEKTKEELLEMINMEQRKEALEYLIEQETREMKQEIEKQGKELEEKDEKLEEKDKEIEKKDEKLEEKDEEINKLNEIISIIKNYYSKEGKIPKEIMTALLKI